jgi:hypothetical protein
MLNGLTTNKYIGGNITLRCGASSELDSSPFATSVAWDWRDQSGWWPVRDGKKWEANSAIGIGHIVQMLLQMFLFAGRMAESVAGAENLDIDRIRLPIDVTRTELLASVDDLTSATANRVFGEFGFKPMANILSELVAEVRR